MPGILSVHIVNTILTLIQILISMDKDSQSQPMPELEGIGL